VSVFLAGGITGCPEWQAELIHRLTGTVDNSTVILNPRRPNFDMANSSWLTNEQIEWEYDYLKLADHKLFWFPKESICPIALFELGKELGRGGINMLIGCDPEYSRIVDIQLQCKLEYKDVIVGFDNFVQEACKRLSDL
jgi:hypothetical protein